MSNIKSKSTAIADHAMVNVARNFLARRPAPYCCPEEEAAFIEAFVYGFKHDHSKEPALIRTEWPNAYGAGFNEGWHQKEKVLCQ